MTPSQFRKLALSLPEAEERSHMSHPDFRVRKKIFATLGYPHERHAMIKLHPGEQANCMESAPDVFGPAAGAWGRGGATTVLLKSAPAARIKAALAAAWRHAAPETLVAAATGSTRSRRR